MTEAAAGRLSALSALVLAALTALTIALPARAAGPAADPVVDAFHAGRSGLEWAESATPPTLSPRGLAVRRALEGAGREGLDPADYAIPAAATPPELDRAVTRVLLRYLTDLQAGRVAPRLADPQMFVHRRAVAGLGLLGAVAASADPARTISDLAPGNPIYRRLRRLLSEYRTLAAGGGWRQVPAGESLKPGASDPRIPAVRHRLAATGEYTPPSELSERYDETLEVAVRAFQRRHGLDPDGVVGRRTVAAMNVPVGERIRQIVLNMERFRWMPDDLGDDHVFVNMAGFELDYVRQGTTRLSMRVVVGRRFRETPIFSDAIHYLEFNPTWSVPRKIAVEDILPRVRRDPGYLAAGGYELFTAGSDGGRPVNPSTVDWRALGPGRFPYRLRQTPGKKNALGRVKFMFPNQFDVYLHDTPAREYFRRSVRTFSSGCIRLEKPLRLAGLLLQADGQDPRRIERILETEETTRVNLATPVPVHLTYLTAWIGEGGTAEFRDDVYGRDAMLAKALRL